MNIASRLPALLVGGLLIGGVAVVASRMIGGGDAAVMAGVKVPQLSAMAEKGKTAFEAVCAQCHGVNGSGTDKGPPLVHNIYNPGHHGDAAFYRAARQGVPRHHWTFGDMPPQPGVTDAQVADIIRYVREIQVANGIVYQEHRM